MGEHSGRCVVPYADTNGGGTYVGATDEIGGEAVEVVHPIRDLHTTILHLMGLDDNKLTFLHGGRYKQLSQTGGEVIEGIAAL